MVITSQISIDLQRPSYPPVVNAVQGDQNTRCIEIALYSGGVSWQVPEGVTVAMRYCKPDKTKGYYDTMPDGSSAYVVSGNSVSILLAPQMLTVPGSVVAQVALMQGAKILSTFAVQVHVEGDPSAGVMDSEDYSNWLQWIEAELDAYLEEVKGKTMPWNILDNSDFRNPINQRGKQNYRGLGYGIDRWHLWHEKGYDGWMVSIEDGYVKVSDNPDSSSTAVNMLRQDLPLPAHLRGKTVTLAARVKGYENVRLNINNTGIGLYKKQNDWYTMAVSCALPEDGETFFVALQSKNPDEEGYLCEWVALYEGEYTEETLPEYQSKGYAAELLECQRYYVSFGNMTFRSAISEESIHNITITFPVRMRVVPTVTATAIEGEVPGANVSENGIAYSSYGKKYTLRQVVASADW